MFPTLNERLRITQLCKGIGLTIDNIKRLFSGESITITGKLHSTEHDRSFNVEDAKLQIFAERDNPDKLLLKLNRQNILDWFKEQFGKLRQVARPHIKPLKSDEQKKGRGIS